MTQPTPNDDAQPTTQTADAGADELATTKRELEETRAALAAARGEQAANITAARDAMRAANPTIPPDLIDGSTAAELQASVAKANEIRSQFAALAGANGHGAGIKVPAGDATPAPAELTSPLAKIRFGLDQRAKS